MGNLPVKSRKSYKPLAGLRGKTNHQVKAQTAQIQALERRYQVMEMRKAGWNVYQIAESLNVDPTTVRQDIIIVMKLTIEQLSETTEEARQLQVERLDGIIKAFYPFATEAFTTIIDGKPCAVPPDPQAAALLLKAEERRAKLLALDKPENKGNDELPSVREYVGVDMDKV